MRVRQVRSYGPSVNRRDLRTDASPGTFAADHDRLKLDNACAKRAMSGSVMVAVNGGASCRSALDWAAAHASVNNSVLRIVHVIVWPRWGLDPVGGVALDWCNTSAPERGTLILEEAARRAHVLAPHATVATHLEAGEPVVAILRAGRREGLIVIGRGRTPRPCGRSVSRAVLHLAQGRVAIIRTPAASQPTGHRR